jgi:hypothetical protein
MMAEARVVEEAWAIDFIQAKPVMPQQPRGKHSEPSNPVCLPAAYASKCITRKGASTGKL